MESQLQEEADDEPRNWLLSRRRRLIAAVVGLMMLSFALESSDETVDDSVKTSQEVTVDDFDRIEALLATKENRRAEGRGPTVEVPADIAFLDERPAFDFDAFDEVMGVSEDTETDVPLKAAATSQPPSRDSFDDLNRVNVLEIPERLALGSKRGLTEEPTINLATNASQNTFQLAGQETTDTPRQKHKAPEDTAAVRIVAEDVTSSQVTRFAPTADPPPSDSSGDRIRFTGFIFPVSRSLDQE